MEKSSPEELKTIPKTIQKNFEDWEKRGHKCIVSEGDYLKWII